jgi:hypothetical protein
MTAEEQRLRELIKGWREFGEREVVDLKTLSPESRATLAAMQHQAIDCADQLEAALAASPQPPSRGGGGDMSLWARQTIPL